MTADGKPGYTSPVTYPTAGGQLPQRLSVLAAMLVGGLPIRCVAVEGAGSCDTHSGQAASLPANLKATIDAVVAFQRDIEARGIADRVLITAGTYTLYCSLPGHEPAGMHATFTVG